MRVLILAHGLPAVRPSESADAAEVGGAELYGWAHARNLASRGHAVLMVAREASSDRPDYAVRSEQSAGVRIVRINNTFGSLRAFRETYANLSIDRAVASAIDEFAPDVAHVHHLTGLSTGIVHSLIDRRVPVVMTLHDYWLICHRGQLLDVDGRVCEGPEPAGCHSCLGVAASGSRATYAGASAVRAMEQRLPAAPARMIRAAAESVARLAALQGAAESAARDRLEHMRHFCGRIGRFLAPSAAIRDRFIGFGVHPERIAVSGYGVDPAPFRNERRTTSDRLRIGFLGSVMVSKGTHVLLEAFAQLPGGAATLDVFGEVKGYHRDESYRRLIARLAAAPDVQMRGPLRHDRVADALSRLDVLVVPSIWPENSPFVIREAFLAGVPVIGSNIGGIPELVTHGRNGLLVPPGDAAALREALTRLLNERQLLSSLREGIPSVRTLDDDVDETVRLYGRLVAEAERPALPPRASATAAVVLNYQAPAQTLLAVRALLRSRRALDHVFVVDNDEAGDCERFLEGIDDRVTYLRQGRNLGFSGGVNAGVRAAFERGADRVLLVNSDAIVRRDCLELLEEALQRHPEAGIAGPLLVDRVQPETLLSRGLSFAPRSGRVRLIGTGEAVEHVERETERVDAVSGCVMLVDRRVFDRVGFFDEDYFFSFEDIDFCVRARRAGFATIVVPAAVAYHEGGRSIGSGSPRRLYFAARNHLRLVRRIAPAGHLGSLGRDVSIVALNLAHAAVRARGGTLASRLSAVIRGARDHAAGRFGAGA